LGKSSQRGILRRKVKELFHSGEGGSGGGAGGIHRNVLKKGNNITFSFKSQKPEFADKSRSKWGGRR